MPGLMTFLGLDSSGLDRGGNAAISKAKGIGSRISSAMTGQVSAGLGGFIGVAALTAMAKRTVDWASNLRDVAEGLSVNVEWLQKMAAGAGLVGGKVEDIEKMMFAVNQAREAALKNPKGEQAGAFTRLGISQNQIREDSSQAFFDRMVKNFAKGGSDINDIIAVGGKTAKNLAAAFQSGFESSIPTLSEDLVDRLDNIGDEFFGLATQMKVSIGEAILFILEKLKLLGNNTAQTASGFGAASVAMESIINNGKDPASFKEFFDKIREEVNAGWKAFQGAVVSTEADQANLQDEVSISKNAVRAARKRREDASPLVNTKTNEAPTSAFGKKQDIGLDKLQQAGAYVRGQDSKILSVQEQSERHLREILNLSKNRSNNNTVGGF